MVKKQNTKNNLKDKKLNNSLRVWKIAGLVILVLLLAGLIWWGISSQGKSFFVQQLQGEYKNYTEGNSGFSMKSIESSNKLIGTSQPASSEAEMESNLNSYLDTNLIE